MSPRKSRKKSACFSRTTTSTPARARRNPSIIPAGPPPAMQHCLMIVESFIQLHETWISGEILPMDGGAEADSEPSRPCGEPCGAEICALPESPAFRKPLGRHRSQLHPSSRRPLPGFFRDFPSPRPAKPPNSPPSGEARVFSAARLRIAKLDRLDPPSRLPP